jgi:phosphoribosylformimino-5-aminoimidazole carboxamide ribotide isomerase
MIAIPAIDLLEGKAVRLAKGDRERVTVYSDQPAKLAESFCEQGAERLHCVDLNGAFGEQRQLELIRSIHEITSARGAKLQVGGGIRDIAAAEALLEAGVDAVVIGTLAIRDPDAVEALCHKYPQRIVVAIDARDGQVAVAGWTEVSELSALELAKRAEAWGAAALLFTDVARDGMQGGAAVQATADIQAAIKIPVIASGGVGSLDDLDDLRKSGAHSVVLGRALYEGNFTVKEAIARC